MGRCGQIDGYLNRLRPLLDVQAGLRRGARRLRLWVSPPAGVCVDHGLTGTAPARPGLAQALAAEGVVRVVDTRPELEACAQAHALYRRLRYQQFGRAPRRFGLPFTAPSSASRPPSSPRETPPQNDGGHTSSASCRVRILIAEIYARLRSASSLSLRGLPDSPVKYRQMGRSRHACSEFSVASAAAACRLVLRDHNDETMSHPTFFNP